MYISSDVASRIKDEAKRRGITVKQLLEDAELGKNMMTMMRSSMPKADNLAKIADVLGCSVDYLLGRDDAPAPDSPVKTETATPEDGGNEKTQQAVAMFSQLTDAEQEMLLAQMKGLADAHRSSHDPHR